MSSDLTPEEADCSKRLFDRVLDAVISMDGGAVRPDIVRAALADVMATVDFNCGLGRDSNQRRRVAEFIGKRYSKLLKGDLLPVFRPLIT